MSPLFNRAKMTSLKGPNPHYNLLTLLNEIETKGLYLSSQLCSSQKNGKIWRFFANFLSSFHLYIPSTNPKIVLIKLENFLRKNTTQKDFFSGFHKQQNLQNMQRLVEHIGKAQSVKSSKKAQQIYKKCLGHLLKNSPNIPVDVTQDLKQTLKKTHIAHLSEETFHDKELELANSKKMINTEIIQEAHKLVENKSENRLYSLVKKQALERIQKQELTAKTRLLMKSLASETYTLEECHNQNKIWMAKYGPNPDLETIKKDPEIIPLLIRFFATCPFDTTEETSACLKYLLKLALFARANKNEKAKEALTRFIQALSKLPKNISEELLEYGFLIAAEQDVDFFFSELQHFNINKPHELLDKKGLLFNIWEIVLSQTSLKVALYLIDNRKVHYMTEQNETSNLLLQIAMQGEVKSELILSYVLHVVSTLAKQAGYHPKKPGIKLKPSHAAIHANNLKLLTILVDHYGIRVTPTLIKLAQDISKPEIVDWLLEKHKVNS